MKDQNELKKEAALTALKYVQEDTIVGVGTGSTVAYFIEGLASLKGSIQGAVASSLDTEQKLKKHGIPVLDINAGPIPLYVDGADEFNNHGQLIKGGGGALTREKIIAAVAEQFVCIVDEKKHAPKLGKFPLPIEVVPMARSLVAREIMKLGGDPELREGFTTDNGNQILDVHNLDIEKPIEMEMAINNITGVVTNGLFAKRSADIILLATQAGIETKKIR